MHMALYELGVNAARFGALRGPKGRVTLDWSVGSDVINKTAIPARLELIWREIGGPPVRLPMRRGFGSRLIEQGLPRELGGEGKLVFDSKGLRFSLSAPFSHRVALAQ